MPLAGTQGFGKVPVSSATGACEGRQENKAGLTRPSGSGRERCQQQHVCLPHSAVAEPQRSVEGTPDGNSVVWQEEVTLLSGLQGEVFFEQAGGVPLQKTCSSLSNAGFG